MSFSKISFTNAGRALQAKALAGTPLVFTKIALGSGSLNGRDPATFTSLLELKVSLSISKTTREGQQVMLEANFSNQDNNTGFYWREVGLFANDPTLGEILYCYGNAGNVAEYIQPSTSSSIEKVITLTAVVGNAQNVTAIINTAAFATKKDISAMTMSLSEVNSKLAQKAKQIDLENINAIVGGNTTGINKLNSLVDALASGAPKPVTLVNQMTDTSKAYLYQGTENGYSAGYIYFHNGNAWVIGQQYLAPDISTNIKNVTNTYLGIDTITNKLSNGNFSSLVGWTSTSDYIAASSLSVSNNTLKVTGTTTARAGARSGTGYFEVGKRYYAKIKVRVTNTQCAIIQLKQGDLKVFGQITNPVENQWYTIDGILTVDNATHSFLYFFHQYADSTTASGKEMEVQFATIIDLTTKYGAGLEPNLSEMQSIMERYDNNWFDGTVSLFLVKNIASKVETLEKNSVKSLVSESFDIFNDKTAVLNTNINYTTGAAVANASFAATNFIEVDQLTTYKVNRNDNMYSQTGNMAFYDESKKYISGQASFYENWTTPVGAKYVRFCVYYGRYNSSNFTFRDMTIVKGNTFLPIDKRNTITNTNVYSNLYGKKWVGIGDSITEENNRAYLHYHDYIKQELGLHFVNKGVSGTGYKKRDNENLAIYQRIAENDFPTDADIITIFAGINDCLFETASIGDASDTGTDTWCGCVNKAITNLQDIYTHVPLGIISPLPCAWTGISEYPNQLPGDVNSRASVFVDKLSQICKLRSIPFLDLFHTSNFRPDNSVWVATYTSCGDSPEGDGLHPNSKGHKLIYRKIMEFVKTLAA